MTGLICRLGEAFGSCGGGGVWILGRGEARYMLLIYVFMTFFYILDTGAAVCLKLNVEVLVLDPQAPRSPRCVLIGPGAFLY